MMSAKRTIILTLILVFGFYIAGFATFLTTLQSKPPQTIANDVDAIVVFTGSSGRVEAGFDYLKHFNGPLLISGVHPNVSLFELSGAALLKKAQHQRIELDYTATSTRENVDVTSNWVARNGFKHIGVITASFHMPRSLMLFKQQAPNIKVSAYPSIAQNPTFKILFKEYNKLLAASVRLL